MHPVFQPYQIHHVRLSNRIVKSGVYEGRSDRNGFPTDAYTNYYEELARGEVGGIITGFAYISEEGRAMQPFQAGIDHPDKVPYFRKVTRAVHKYDCPIFLQIAHTGRQTRRHATGQRVRGVSSKRSAYFRQRPKPFSTAEVKQKIVEFELAAALAREAGFDGVQLHAAHGYLIHQFLRPSVNDRKDEFGVDERTGLGTEFLSRTVQAVRRKCGNDFPVLVKISGGDDLQPLFTFEQFNTLIGILGSLGLAGIEISYGTMDHPLNIFRGDFPEKTILSKNPILRSSNPIMRGFNGFVMKNFFKPMQIPFSPYYNLHYAAVAKKSCSIPVISIGGFRCLADMSYALDNDQADLIGMARPFICEPDLVIKLQQNGSHCSLCNNCNLCAVMCDTENETRCYRHLKS